MNDVDNCAKQIYWEDDDYADGVDDAMEEMPCVDGVKVL